MKVTIQTEKTEKIEREITIPSYWKREDMESYKAILTENLVFNVSLLGETHIDLSTSSTLYFLSSEYPYIEISAEEFKTAYNKTVTAANLLTNLI